MEFCVKVSTEGILEEVIKDYNKNIVMSPFSLNLVLNMAASGSSGETLKQFLGCLGSETIADLSSKSSSLMALFKSEKMRKNAPELSLVNILFLDHCSTLKPSFQNTVRDIYKTEARMVDFINQAEKVRNEVNSWAEEKTKGLIKDFLPPSVELQPPLILANALYFKAAWMDQFEALWTRDEDFHLLNGETIKAPFMTRIKYGTQSYGSFEDFKVIRLYYNQGEYNRDDHYRYNKGEEYYNYMYNHRRRFYMDIILPDRKDGLQDVLHKFNSDPKLLLLQRFDELQTVIFTKLWIPKWKFSYDLDTVGLMKKLGLTLPFHYPDADFTKMMDSPGGDELFIKKFLHKSHIEVNEEGTEAAAVSAALISSFTCSRDLPPEAQFVADHPFMFIIREQFSGTVIFTGVVLNPLSHN